MNEQPGLHLIEPSIVPVLDPGFRPAVLANHAFREAVKKSGQSTPVHIALERSPGSVSRFSTDVFAASHPESGQNFQYLERLIKFLLWSRGGARIHFCGPRELGERLQQHYKTSATGRFDASIMGEKIYETPLEVVLCEESDLPAEEEKTMPLGRHLKGCRIGFDLGASDRKVAAVIDGETVFSEEFPWHPLVESDPQWHYDQINEGLKKAAAKMPRVDAIGGSSAGVYVNNQVKVASLFRGVPQDLFQTKVKNIFLDLQKEWNIPFDVVNDGEVTALAGAMAIDDNGVLGVAMGSSEAVGYVDQKGNITSWLNELAFAPVDYNPQAAVDEWSGDYGVGALYFSQQCVGRLVAPAGIDLPSGMPLPEKLVEVQKLMAQGDERAARIYHTIGVYLGYGIAHYADFYDFNYLLVLGRVTTGRGGEIILEEARKVLDQEFPELSRKVKFHVPDEKEKRHGQAMAAASLPVLAEENVASR
jgi:predicted NBD/HSP70 family sugar kinase